MVQRWRREDWQRSAAPVQNIEAGFVPLRLASACDSPVQTESIQAAPAQVAVVESESIRMELSRASGTLTVHWPVSAAGQCAQLLRELLR
jgi:transposase